jgi:uncharacterized protein (TIGR03032 family)
MNRARDRWSAHDAAWRDPAQVVSQWEDAQRVDPALLRSRASSGFWDLLEEAAVTLLVTREYEHLAVGLTALAGRPRASVLSVPHPSGLAVDRARGVVYLASTRNPNQIYDLAPSIADGRPLVPVRTRFFPGSLYVHDLALVGGALHANAVGQNAVVRLDPDGSYERVWWPKAIETDGRPDFAHNYLQLNSIAAGPSLVESCFSASADRISTRRPGHRNFPVDGRGVIFSGRTREPVVRGLTRPHSARFQGGRLWVDNSGYGEIGTVEDGRFTALARLPGWTRGLGFHGRLAFVGVSRVIPRFRAYAPGLDLDRSVCGVYALDTRSGEVRGRIVWPEGNQVFAVEPVPQAFSLGFPFRVGRRRSAEAVRLLFYDFVVDRRRRS